MSYQTSLLVSNESYNVFGLVLHFLELAAMKIIDGFEERKRYKISYYKLYSMFEY